MPPTRTPYTPPPDAEPVIRHVDARFVIVDKPAGLLSVPGREPEKADCLESRIRRTHPGALTVHRLDMETSGLVVFALDPEAQAALSKLFERRAVEKTYIARVSGAPPERGVIDLPVGSDWPNRPKQKAGPEGKPARTEYERLEIENGAARLALRPVTGRTHQLRVHLDAIGHPILGDSLYGSPASRAAAPRLQLHAARLVFRHPFADTMIDVESPCPF